VGRRVHGSNGWLIDGDSRRYPDLVDGADADALSAPRRTIVPAFYERDAGQVRTAGSTD